MWYSKTSPNHMYLQCLIDAEVLHDAGLTPIPYWAACPGRVWGRLLKGLAAKDALRADIEGAPWQSSATGSA